MKWFRGDDFSLRNAHSNERHTHTTLILFTPHRNKTPRSTTETTVKIYTGAYLFLLPACCMNLSPRPPPSKSFEEKDLFKKRAGHNSHDAHYRDRSFLTLFSVRGGHGRRRSGRKRDNARSHITTGRLRSSAYRWVYPDDDLAGPPPLHRHNQQTGDTRSQGWQEKKRNTHVARAGLFTLLLLTRTIRWPQKQPHSYLPLLQTTA